MNCEGKRAQSGIGADVAGGPFAPNVLLTGRQGQDPAPPASCVDRLPDEAPRHLADEPVAGGEQPDMRSAETERVAERLALGGHDVCADVAGRANGAERQDFGDDDDEQGAGIVADPREPGIIPYFSEKIGVLHHDA